MDLDQIYRKALWFSIKESIKNYEPVFIRGRIQFRIHKWLYKLKAEGKIIPMPDGVREAQRRETNLVGTLIKYKNGNLIYAGEVRGEFKGRLSVIPLVEFQEYRFRSSVRYQWRRVESGAILIGEEQYNRTSLYSWLNSNKKRIDPVINPAQFIRMLKK